MNAPCVIWTITDGGAGMQAQAIGMMNALAQQTTQTTSTHSYTVDNIALANLLSPALAAGLGLYRFNEKLQGAPTLAVACGAASQAAVLGVKKQYNARAVCIQRPRGSEADFDFIVAPRHDYSEHEIRAIEQNPDSKIILTLGAVGKLSPQALDEHRPQAHAFFNNYAPPFVGVLIGGENRAYRPQAKELIMSLKGVALYTRSTLLITPSRRSDDSLINALHAEFGDKHYVWDGSGENPYMHIMAAASAFCVTCDSVNMISEACVTGKPVYILPLAMKSYARAQKFQRFHLELITANHARIWRDFDFTTWTPPAPLAETARAAARILKSTT